MVLVPVECPIPHPPHSDLMMGQSLEMHTITHFNTLEHLSLAPYFNKVNCHISTGWLYWHGGQGGEGGGRGVRITAVIFNGGHKATL